MNLQTYTPDVLPSLRSTKPYLQMNTKTGLININAGAVEAMGLSSTDKIAFHQDKDNPENWYLENQGKKGNGFETRAKEEVSKGGLMFNSTSLVRKIFESVAFEGQSGRLLIGEPIKPTRGGGTLYTLITANLKNE